MSNLLTELSFLSQRPAVPIPSYKYIFHSLTELFGVRRLTRLSHFSLPLYLASMLFPQSIFFVFGGGGTG